MPTIPRLELPVPRAPLAAPSRRLRSRRGRTAAVPALLVALLWGVLGAVGAPAQEAPPAEVAAPVEWALAIHGGAGVIPKDMPEEAKKGYFEALDAALALGRDHLGAGGSALDTVEKVVLFLEEDPRFNAGKGAVYTHEGTHELDAAIMDGRDRSAGAVAAVKTVRNPVRLARLVMERSPHVFLIGEGAEAFAGEMGVERVANTWFDTERRRESLERALERERQEAGEQGSGENREDGDAAEGGERGASLGGLEATWEERSDDRKYGTVGAVALDRDGHLAAATSTGGLTNKRFGRVGDVPVIGAGTYADDETCAVSATGKGEEFIKNTVARSISARVAFGEETCGEAAHSVVHGVLQPGDGGVIVVAADGAISLVFNSPGMFRGAADSAGRFETAIWEADGGGQEGEE